MVESNPSPKTGSKSLKAARTPTAGEQPRVSPNMQSRGTPSNSSNNSHPSPIGS